MPQVRARRRQRTFPALLCLPLAALAWLTPACASWPGSAPGGAGAGTRPWPLTLPATVKVRVGTAGAARLVTLALEEYVLGAVRAEMLPATLRARPANRALDVQAIVSRSYAAASLRRHAAEGYDLCDTTHCQVYRPAAAGEGPADPAAKAVSATRGQVLTFQGRVVQALFHADCGGHTASAASVWGGTDAPYLASVPDWYCQRRPASGWTFAAEEAAVIRALNADPRTRIGDRLGRVEIASRAPAGRALAVTLVGSTTVSVRAEVFRAAVTQAFGSRSLRSTWFDVTRDGPRLRFSGVGFGHGVGLCQSGTLRRVEARQSPAEILAHYFPGSRLQSLSSARARPDLSERLLGR
ncbi:MAG: SpoIID/LytB domain-containing protein [Vicinamibacterales bacterium]